MTIELSDYRLRIGLHYYRQAKVKGLSYLTTFELGGNSNLTNEQNKSIMIAVQEFITQSGRFKIQ